MARRDDKARKLHAAWQGLTNAELVSAMWHSLPAEDRQVWLDKVDADD